MVDTVSAKRNFIYQSYYQLSKFVKLKETLWNNTSLTYNVFTIKYETSWIKLLPQTSKS